jgi:hypothetical protein
MIEKDDYEIWLNDLEQDDDENNVARTLHGSGWLPDGCPRLEALFLRAIGGNGYYSQLLQAYYGSA